MFQRALVHHLIIVIIMVAVITPKIMVKVVTHACVTDHVGKYPMIIIPACVSYIFTP